ncbi:hypothetical protein DPMN_045288 [Dreissena polymorpha]|uniref:Uncharacterized protein n=1 Tax=Dreissena polymorpha TaxID=45954 RepID=A0A9D4D646_DREPO|nr:hypothetical protein DPMN_045288 [Dreissena polymorpha]
MDYMAKWSIDPNRRSQGYAPNKPNQEAYFKAEHEHFASRQVLVTSTAEGDNQIKQWNDHMSLQSTIQQLRNRFHERKRQISAEEAGFCTDEATCDFELGQTIRKRAAPNPVKAKMKLAKYWNALKPVVQTNTLMSNMLVLTK